MRPFLVIVASCLVLAIAAAANEEDVDFVKYSGSKRLIRIRSASVAQPEAALRKLRSFDDEFEYVREDVDFFGRMLDEAYSMMSASMSMALCPFMDEDRAAEIFDILSTVSSPENLKNPETSEGMAYLWIVEEDARNICPDNKDSVIQRFAMAVLYFAFEGDSWREGSRLTGPPNFHWLSEASECAWKRLPNYEPRDVKCNSAGEIVDIPLSESSVVDSG